MVGGPIAGRLAVITIDGTKVGKLRNVRCNFAVKMIKDYSMDGVSPEVLHPGEEAYTFSAEKLWVDDAYANIVLGQSAGGLDVIIYPAGEVTGEMAIVLGEAIFTRYQLTEDKDGVAAESIEGEARTVDVDSTYPVSP